MIPLDWFDQARERIRPHIVRTPLTYDARNDLYLKWENHQVTGSFKARGAFNKVLSLESWERAGGLVAASAGNHGQGVALAASLTKTAVEVFVPTGAAQNKVDAIRALGAQVVRVDGGYGEAEQAAQEYARKNGRVFVSPYNDGQIIAGQGTLALEIVEQLQLDHQVNHQSIGVWILPAGGGGLISGCGAALAATNGTPKMIGVQAAASAFTYNLIKHGTQDGVPDGPTLADGLSGAIDGESMTIPMMRQVMQDIIAVSEDSIARAIARAWWAYGERIEGSAATALAAAIEGGVEARPAVVVLSGGNIDQDVFEGIIRKHDQRAPA